MPQLPPPFSDRPVSAWITQFQNAHSADDRFRALQAIASLCSQTEVAECAARGLSDVDATVKALAAKLLGTINGLIDAQREAILEALLSDGDPDVRFESARALIRLKSDRANLAARTLLTFLDELETDPLMLAAVINGLIESDLSGSAANSDVRPRIEKLINHDRAEVREAVASTFARWPQMAVASIQQLLPLIDDSEPIVREKIALMLGEAGLLDDAIQTALQSASQDEDAEVARTAADALRKLATRKA